MARLNLGKFKQAVGKVKSAAEKREETKMHITRMAEMQQYVDNSEEKINLLFDTLHTKAQDCDKTILEKGVVTFIYYVDILQTIKERLEDAGIKVLVVNAKSTPKQRLAVSEEFMKDPSNTVCLISTAGSESVDLNSTNEIILYDIPDGIRKYTQTIGRIVRGFGDFEEFYIHFIMVDETLDEYKPVLLSSRREMGLELLGEDNIPLKETGSFNATILKNVRKKKLWKIANNVQE